MQWFYYTFARNNTAPRKYSCGIYRLTPTIRNKILNYKETVQSIIVDDEISFPSSAGTCNCERSTFRDENHD